MPNIMTVLKDEIIRLARKEVRSETESLKKASAQYRSNIAALKRQVVALEKQIVRREKKASKGLEPAVEGEASTKFRYSAKRFAAQRKKLGLSAGDMGALVGVSAQTIYNWEAEKSRPRQQQLAAIAAVRKLGKRQIKAELENQAE
jgi:DNA-binding transcriptional regulator YiaG